MVGFKEVTDLSTMSSNYYSEYDNPFQYQILLDKSFIIEPNSPVQPLKDEPDNIDKILSSFKQSKSLQLLKTNFRISLIRGHKRLNRFIITGKSTKDNLTKLDPSNMTQVKALADFKTFTIENIKVLKKASKTKKGPLSDGKAKRLRNSVEENEEKSFNKNHIKQYFSNETVSQSFQLFIEYLCADQSNSDLCKRFGISPIDPAEDSWQSLKEYLITNFI